MESKLCCVLEPGAECIRCKEVVCDTCMDKRLEERCSQVTTDPRNWSLQLKGQHTWMGI